MCWTWPGQLESSALRGYALRASVCVFMCGTVNLCSLFTDGGHSGSSLGGKGPQSSQVS